MSDRTRIDWFKQCYSCERPWSPGKDGRCRCVCPIGEWIPHIVANHIEASVPAEMARSLEYDDEFTELLLWCEGHGFDGWTETPSRRHEDTTARAVGVIIRAKLELAAALALIEEMDQWVDVKWRRV